MFSSEFYKGWKHIVLSTSMLYYFQYCVVPSKALYIYIEKFLLMITKKKKKA
jgi:hypothetical protein